MDHRCALCPDKEDMLQTGPFCGTFGYQPIVPCRVSGGGFRDVINRHGHGLSSSSTLFSFSRMMGCIR